MLKICTSCKQEKNISEFNKNCSKKDGLQNLCKKCQSKNSKSYYLTHTEEHKIAVCIRRKDWRHKLYDYVNQIKSSGCCLCPEKDVACIDFHHLDNQTKESNIADITRSGLSLKRLQIELKKCICLCANCHRKLHAGKIMYPTPSQVAAPDF